jgi:serine/threonine protein kinase
MQVHHILLGLVYLHSKKVVHGDLKAVNIIHVLIVVTCSDDNFILAQRANRRWRKSGFMRLRPLPYQSRHYELHGRSQVGWRWPCGQS